MWFTNFCRVLPTTQVGYFAGTPIESSVCCSNRNLALLLLNSEGWARPVRLQNFWLNAFRFVLETFNLPITLCDWSGKRSNGFLWPTCKAVMFGWKERVRKEKSGHWYIHWWWMNQVTYFFRFCINSFRWSWFSNYSRSVLYFPFVLLQTGGIWLD